MADRMRNEVDLVVGDTKRVMRATVEALRGIESDLGKSTMRVVSDFATVDYGIRHITSVLYHGLKGGENDVTLEGVAKDVMAIGLDAGAEASMKFLNVAMNGQTLGKPKKAAASR